MIELCRIVDEDTVDEMGDAAQHRVAVGRVDGGQVAPAGPCGDARLGQDRDRGRDVLGGGEQAAVAQRGQCAAILGVGYPQVRGPLLVRAHRLAANRLEQFRQVVVEFDALGAEQFGHSRSQLAASASAPAPAPHGERPPAMLRGDGAAALSRHGAPA